MPCPERVRRVMRRCEPCDSTREGWRRRPTEAAHGPGPSVAFGAGEGRQSGDPPAYGVVKCWARSASHSIVWRSVALCCVSPHTYILYSAIALRHTALHCTARHGTARHGTARHGTARRGTARHGTARRGTARHGTARHGVAWRGVAWRGVAWRGVAWRCSGAQVKRVDVPEE